ncbi:DinB family protein [Namhaeicola litoreus]|uniref:DinB family protein n=1 Tax=Namhaeicola litoreus TaxID=1052145 RepID=A0ABW3Y3R2_9FLAO
MIDAILQNLERGKKLVVEVDDAQFNDNSVAPYFSSIGIHMRHVLDVFDCIFDGLPSGNIDLTHRKRNVLVEQDKELCISYFNRIHDKLSDLSDQELEVMVSVHDDLGLGKLEAQYTLAAILIQAHSHAIHHFASIGYIIHQLGISLPDADFGYNPTTPRAEVNSKNLN